MEIFPVGTKKYSWNESWRLFVFNHDTLVSVRPSGQELLIVNITRTAAVVCVVDFSRQLPHSAQAGKIVLERRSSVSESSMVMQLA
jgi:hypothetical protein